MQSDLCVIRIHVPQSKANNLVDWVCHLGIRQTEIYFG
jgi:hypothetical protein